MNLHWNHVLVMLLCAEVILSVNGNGQQQHSSNCHTLDRSGRRCSNGSGFGAQNGYNRNAHPHSSSADDEESGNFHGDRYSGHSSKHSSANERQSHSHGKKGSNGTRIDSWPGHSLSANSSWSALSNLNNHNYELTTEVTTTESSNDIERFLVGRRRRKRSSLWMNPTLLYSRTISHSMSGNRNIHGHNEEEEEEEEAEEESNEHGHSGSESSRASAVTRQIVHERTSSNHGHGSFSGGGSHGTSHSSGSSSGTAHGGNHSNRMPLFLVPRTNTVRAQI